MTCPGELELARAIAAGADPAMEAHLAACPACREAWEATRRVIDLARELPAAIPSQDRREEVRTAVLAAAASVTRRPARRAWLAPALAAAAAAGLIGYLAFPRGSSGQPGPLMAQASEPSSGPSPEPSVARHAHGTVHPHPRARYLAISPGPDEVVQLADGAIEVEVEPLHPGERFRVVVGGAEVEVRGTVFTVTAREDHLVGVTVTRGRVEVRPQRGAPAVLGAGQSWHAAPEAMSSPTAEAAVTGAPLVTPSPSPASSPGPSSASPPSPASSPASSPGPSSVPPPRAAVLVPSSPKHPSAPPPRGAATLAPPHVTEQARPTVDDPSAASPPVQPPTDPARPPEELLYDQAWEALRANDFAKAASGFARVLLLAPESPLVEDASFWHAVALARGKRSAEALSAFRDFLDTYARSSRAGEASVMLGWILIDARMYDEAARRFRAAASDPSPAVRGSAQAGLDALATRTH
jgi:FecR protein